MAARRPKAVVAEVVGGTNEGGGLLVGVVQDWVERRTMFDAR